MRSIKMFGLAVLAALMAMAFVGAGSAMAESTSLCNVDPGAGSTEVCPAGHLLSHVHERTLEGSKAKRLTSALTTECDVLFLGDVLSANLLGNPLLISGTFTYTNCGSCTATEVNGPADIKVLKLGHELADVTGEYEIHIECGSLINCTYDGIGLLSHALGPLLASETNGEVRLEEQELHKVAGGLLCPKTARLDILTTPFLSASDITLAEAMGEPFRSGPTYITN